jgi:hypothetical protein
MQDSLDIAVATHFCQHDDQKSQGVTNAVAFRPPQVPRTQFQQTNMHLSLTLASLTYALANHFRSTP